MPDQPAVHLLPDRLLVHREYTHLRKSELHKVRILQFHQNHPSNTESDPFFSIDL